MFLAERINKIDLMPFIFRYIYIVFVFVILSCVKPATTPSNPRVLGSPVPQSGNSTEPAIMTLGSKGIPKSELITSIENSAELDSGTTDQIVKDLLQRKLFVAEARANGMDTIKNFREQMESNISLAVESVLQDKQGITTLGNEAYDRYLKEINASHILIPVSPYANPADTLKLYKDLMNIRDLALKNKDFETQAKRWSKDVKTATTGGSLGWFSVFNLYYPLETAVYTIPKDSISKPIRTKAGYHLVKVNDTRKNSGTVKVQHIFKYVDKNTSAQQINRLYTLLDSVKTEIERGAKFEDMVVRFSDDFNSRDVNGLLPEFGVGTRVEAAFEDIAFNLRKDEISKPFQSSNGIHIIRLVEKNKPLTKAKFLESNANKLTTDSRAEFLESKRIESLKEKYTVSTKNDVLENALKFASVRILGRNWVKPSTVILNDILVSIKEKSFTVRDFFEFIEERQGFEKWPSDSPSEIFNMFYDKFLNANLIKYQQEIALKQNPEMQRWVKAQEENILYSEFFDKNILEKSLKDTLAQKLFYDKNKQLFTTKELGTLTVLSFADAETHNKYKEMAKGAKPYKLNRGITPISYTQNDFSINLPEQRRLLSLVEILNSNPGYIVEIGGHADSKEGEEISELRIKEVVGFLMKNGVPLKRLLEVNYRKSIVLDRFDWSKNQVVTFQFFSNLETDLAKLFNSRNENAIVLQTFKVSKADFESKMKTTWGNKSGTITVDGRIEEFTLRVKKVRGTYHDFRPEIIEKYQEQLTNDLVKRLSNKFNLNYNPTEVNNIINDLKKSK